MNFIGIGGGILPAAEAVVSVRDHGFLYGMGLFETMRTYGGKPFGLDRHLRRLSEGCRELGICYEPDEKALSSWLGRLMEANGLTEAYVRYTVTAGEEELGLPAGPYMSPGEVLYAKPLPVLPARLYTEGKDLQLLRLRRNTPEGEIRRKSLHYMNNILAKRELGTYPSAAYGAEGLMLEGGGFVSEGIVSNLFFVAGGKLYTPAVATGLLPGITREIVMELAHEAGIPCEEGWYGIERLRAADELFLTNSIQELVPVTGLFEGERRSVIGKGVPGPVTLELLQKYRLQAEDSA